MSYNQLSSLALSSSGLPSLEELYVCGNRITSLDAVEQFPALDVLDVRDNALETLEAVRGLRFLTTLSSIMISGNTVAQEAR